MIKFSNKKGRIFRPFLFVSGKDSIILISAVAGIYCGILIMPFCFHGFAIDLLPDLLRSK